MNNLPLILPLVITFAIACKGFSWPEEESMGGSGSPHANNTLVFSITGTNPSDSAALVANNTQIVVHFSETVNTGTLSYNSSNGACGTNSLQVSSDNFVNCIGLTTPTWSGSQDMLTLTPLASLANGTTYKIRVKTNLVGATGRTLSADFTTPTGFTTAPPGVLVPSMSSPSEGATSVSINTALLVNFTHALNPGTLSYNGTAGACTGTFQVSLDNFVNCIAFPSHVLLGGNTQLSITPGAVLNYNSLYKVRVTTGLVGAGAETLSGTFTSTGFTTVTPPALTVSLTTPADGATGVSTSTTFLLTFNYAVSVGTVTYNGSAGACTGSVQVSADGFSTCVGLNIPAWGGGNTQMTLTPIVALNPGALYRIKVATAVTGVVGNLLASDYTTPSGVGMLINAPASLQVFSSNARTMLIWPTVAGATSYNIYYSTTPGVTTGSGTLIAGVTAPYTHTGITNGTTYYYIVAGANGGNVGTASVQASVIPVAQKTIFVTSATYTGNLGGLPGADSNCVARAGAAVLSGNYRAYLSTTADDAICRILGLSGKLASNCGLPVAPNLSAIGPYVNRNSVQVAASLQDLVSNTLSSQVGFDETGASAGGATPFTGTANGVQSGVNCSDWTDDNLLSNGLKGSSSSASSTWSSNGTSACSLLGLVAIAPIYCVRY